MNRNMHILFLNDLCISGSMASIHVRIFEVSPLPEPSMFPPQIQSYHRLAGTQICGSSESAG
ncbi:MAG: hypothetical protein DME25_18140, partial [Verrucomicrobia bacterium]